MLLLVTLVAFALLGWNIRDQFVISALRAENRTHALTGRSDDEDVLAMLEAHAATSELAARLLAAGRAESSRSLPEPESPRCEDDAWCGEQWESVWEQYRLETTDNGRVTALRRYLDAKVEFTEQQKTALLERIEGEEERDEARRALYPPEKRRRRRRPAPFRWSKQPLTMICTMTCECGRPARLVSGPILEVQCVCQQKTLRTHIQMTKQMIYVNPNGEAWRYAGSSEWCKAAID